MALSRSKKTENVQWLSSELQGSTSAIVGTFAGLTAAKDFELRKAVRSAGGKYHVVKNKLVSRASEGTKVGAALQGLKGVSSVAYTDGDPVALAKALSTWVKDNAAFSFKLGIVDGRVITVEEIGALATLPGKEELFSKLLFLIQSPAQRLATVINAPGRDLAVVINQAVEKEKFSGSAVPPAAGAAVPSESSPAPAEPAASIEPVVSTESAAAIEPASAGDGHVIAEAHADETPAANEIAQPENATASQAGEAATTDPVEG